MKKLRRRGNKATRQQGDDARSLEVGILTGIVAGAPASVTTRAVYGGEDRAASVGCGDSTPHLSRASGVMARARGSDARIQRPDAGGWIDGRQAVSIRGQLGRREGVESLTATAGRQ